MYYSCTRHLYIIIVNKFHSIVKYNPVKFTENSSWKLQKALYGLHSAAIETQKTTAIDFISKNQLLLFVLIIYSDPEPDVSADHLP